MLIENYSLIHERQKGRKRESIVRWKDANERDEKEWNTNKLKDKRKSFDTLENSVKYAKQLNKYRLSETESTKVKMKKYGVNSSMA